jgi:hypothetical protein
VTAPHNPDQYEYAWSDPASDLVALRGGPQDLRWYFYRDWLTVRKSSRRGQYRLSRPCGTPRCYAPTTQWTRRTDDPESPMRARVWHYIPPAQWAAWGREYLTPDEKPAAAPTIPAPRTSTQAGQPAKRNTTRRPAPTAAATTTQDSGDTALLLPLWTDRGVA